MKFTRKALCLLLIALLVAPMSAIALAQDTPVATEASAETLAEQNPDPAAATSSEKKYYYEQPTRQKFSRLYWALDLLDINNDEDVDNYLMFNECEIYKSEFFNELEWKDIRESARAFLKENKSTFPIRFEVVQPLFLGEYDVNTKKFDVLDKYKIKPTTRIEIMAKDYAEIPCIRSGSSAVITKVPRYPAGILAEFNVPLEATTIPVDPETAELYIQEKAAPIKQRSEQSNKDMTQAKFFNARDAYIFMRVKFFAAKGITRQRGDGYELANILTILEGIEVYADRDKKMLLWKKDFKKKRSGAPSHVENTSIEDAENVVDDVEDAETNEPVQSPPDAGTPPAQ